MNAHVSTEGAGLADYEVNRECGFVRDSKDGDTLQFGIHHGRQIEFEYEVTTPSWKRFGVSDSLAQSLFGLEKGSALLRSTNAIAEGNIVRGVIKVSMALYNAWLAEVASRDRRLKDARLAPWPIDSYPEVIQVADKPATGTTDISHFQDGICRRTNVRDADFSDMWLTLYCRSVIWQCDNNSHNRT